MTGTRLCLIRFIKGGTAEGGLKADQRLEAIASIRWLCVLCMLFDAPDSDLLDAKSNIRKPSHRLAVTTR